MTAEPIMTELRDEGLTHQYTDELPEDISIARKVLEGYSGISPDQVIPHILAIHAKAIKHPEPYPCITSFRFLQFHITTHPLYTHILSRLSPPTSTQCLLDFGTCFGQDLRIFARDGARTQNLYGLDQHREFIELGFELFQDRDRLAHHFVVGDILAKADGPMDKLKGKMDIISATAFLQIFSWEEQIQVCTRMVDFLKPVGDGDEERQVVFGRQSGSAKPGPRFREEVNWGRREVFLHDVESFRQLWQEVGRRTRTKWEVRGELRKIGKDGVKGIEDAETARLLIFTVWRCDKGVGKQFEPLDGEMRTLRVEKDDGELEEERIARELIEDRAI